MGEGINKPSAGLSRFHSDLSQLFGHVDPRIVLGNTIKSIDQFQDNGSCCATEDFSGSP